MGSSTEMPTMNACMRLHYCLLHTPNMFLNKKILSTITTTTTQMFNRSEQYCTQARPRLFSICTQRTERERIWSCAHTMNLISRKILHPNRIFFKEMDSTKRKIKRMNSTQPNQNLLHINYICGRYTIINRTEILAVMRRMCVHSHSDE